MKKLLISFFALLVSFSAMAEKHALIIAIGNYPTRTGWKPISSLNDVDLIKNTLLTQKFEASNITVIRDREATKAGILKAIDDLYNRIKPGDIVVIHYSGHGQQVFDKNGDENDRLDEAIVPIDALVEYSSNYQGENHITDDKLNEIITKFRNELGKNGELLMLLDSCHSGSATRAAGVTRGGVAALTPPNWDTKKDSNIGSGMSNDKEIEEGVKLKNDAARFVIFSGASANELNYEYEGYGSLSFAFSKAMNDLGNNNVTYRNLFSKIEANMNIISPNQTPTMEGDSDFELFNGKLVKPDPFYTVTEIPRPDMIKINAGKLQRLFPGTTFHILPNDATKVEESRIVSSGKIASDNKFNESIITLDKPLESSNTKEYRVFVDKATYGDISTNIYFDKSFKSKSVKNAITAFLEEKKLGQIVKDTANADLFISESKDKNSISIKPKNGLENIYVQTKIDGDYNTKDITLGIFNYSQGKYLKNLEFKNYDYEFAFRLLPAQRSKQNPRKIELLEEDLFTDKAGKFKVREQSSGDMVVLEVSNFSGKDVYFSIIEINPKGEVFPFMPNKKCNFTDQERLIPAGETVLFNNCIYRFNPPYETLVLKGFATPMPINFRPTVNAKGNTGTRGPGEKPNPLQDFIAETYTQTRGSTSSRNESQVDGFSTEFVYEIVKTRD